MSYSITIENNALQDIQDAIDYYDQQQIGLGEKFEQNIHKSIIALQKIRSIKFATIISIVFL